jgi:acetolactate synthase I/II/III large subunit
MNWTKSSSYAILNIELARVGAGDPGPKAFSMLDLHNPELDWVRFVSGMGSRRAARPLKNSPFASALKIESPSYRDRRVTKAFASPQPK